MENSNVKPKNTWKVIAITLIVSTVILAGTTTWFAIQNNDKENDNQGNSSIVEDTSKLVVKEWGLFFIRPQGFTELSYRITNNRLDFAGIMSTNRDVGMNAIPAHFSFKFDDDFVHIERYRQDDDPLWDCLVGCNPYIETSDGYRYYFIQRLYVQEEEKLPDWFATKLLRYMFANMEQV